MSQAEITDPSFMVEGFPSVYADGLGVGLGYRGDDEVLYIRVYNKARNIQLIAALTEKQAASFASDVAKGSFELRGVKQ